MSVVENCSTCDAHCCRHIAVHIDKPVTKKEIDHVRWYLLHENVWVSIDHEGDWLLEFRTPCRKIDDNKCGDYDNRPQICRQYPSENDLCERQSEEKSYKHLFTNENEFELHIKAAGRKKTSKNNTKK